MKLLVQGGQTNDRFELLLQLTRIASEDVIEALRDHLVRGMTTANAAGVNGVEQSALNRALKTLEKQANVVEQIKVIDWRHIKQLSVNSAENS